MNIFTRMKNAIDGKRQERLKGDLMAIIKTEFGFDAIKHMIPEAINNATYEQDKVVENLVWYSAKELALIEYYKKGANSSLKNQELGEVKSFWSTAPSKIRRLHTGLPREISKKQATILFGNGYTLTCMAYSVDKDGKVSDKQDSKATKHCQELVDQFRNGIQLNKLLARAARANSWSGHIAIKLGFNFKLSPYPIAQVYDRRNFELIQESGITTAIIFHNHFSIKKS